MLRERREKQQKLDIVILEQLVPKDHLLRRIDEAVDFSFMFLDKNPLQSRLSWLSHLLWLSRRWIFVCFNLPVVAVDDLFQMLLDRSFSFTRFKYRIDQIWQASFTINFPLLIEVRCVIKHSSEKQKLIVLKDFDFGLHLFKTIVESMRRQNRKFKTSGFIHFELQCWRDDLIVRLIPVTCVNRGGWCPLPYSCGR